MSSFWRLAELLPSLTPEQLGALIVLAGFGLAAFAIYAVFEIAKSSRK